MCARRIQLMMRWTMSTSLSVRGETCSRISQRSNRKVSSVFEPLVSIFPVHSIFEYYIDRKCLLLISVWMVAMVCKYFRQSEFDILKKIQQYSTLYLYLYRYWPNDLFFFALPLLIFPPNDLVSLHVQWMLMEQKTSIITQTVLFGNAGKCLWKTNQEVTKLEI